MYPEEIIKSFKQLKKQYYRCRTQKGLDRYSKIESYKNEYISFLRFCNSVEEYFSWRYQDEPTPETIQEVFDNLL